MDIGRGGDRRNERNKERLEVQRIKFLTTTGGHFKQGPPHLE
jgi:hypothetical protein